MNNPRRHHCARMVYCLFINCAIIFSIFTLDNSALAQVMHSSQQLNLEQLFQRYGSLKSPSPLKVFSDEYADEKCGFGLRTHVHTQWNAFSALQKIELLQQIPPSTQKERVIGRFKICYDTSATSHVPALLDANGQPLSNTAEAYVDSVGAIFNYVYSAEVDGLGYPPSPHEQGEPYYRVIIQDMNYYNGRPYGFPDWDSEAPLNPGGYPLRYACFVVIDKSYRGYKTEGINGLKATAAHEFHHVIQVGSYGYRDDEVYAHELTSTWMEDVVYTYVNDYYNYLHNYFDNYSRGISFNAPDYGGYERCIWAHYLAKRFNRDIIREVWDGMKTLSFLESTNTALVNHGSDLRTAFSEFTFWNYFTADRADTVKYYPEGNCYPRFQPYQKKSYQNMPDTVGGDIYPLSSSIYEFDFPSDTIMAMISNVEIEAAEQKNGMTRRVDILLSSSIPSVPYQEFGNGLTAKVIVADTSLWRFSFSQGVRRDTMINPRRFAVSSNASPNPFRLEESQQLLLPIQDKTARTADVYFYSSSLNLVYSKLLPVGPAGSNWVIALQSSELKSCLSSGIYFIIAKVKNNEYRWKVAVIR
jgi:hypothetical protein